LDNDFTLLAQLIANDFNPFASFAALREKDERVRAKPQ
jgi:hypothetical protein